MEVLLDAAMLYVLREKVTRECAWHFSDGCRRTQINDDHSAHLLYDPHP